MKRLAPLDLALKREFLQYPPQLTATEAAVLEASIRDNGLVQPLVVWRGFIVDGRHRFDICSRLGVELKTEDISELDERQMRERVRALNEHRRARTKPMSNEEKRQMVEAALCGQGGTDAQIAQRSGDESNRAIARACGVSDHTVAALRGRLIANGHDVNASNAPPAGNLGGQK